MDYRENVWKAWNKGEETKNGVLCFDEWDLQENFSYQKRITDYKFYGFLVDCIFKM